MGKNDIINTKFEYQYGAYQEVELKKLLSVNRFSNILCRVNFENPNYKSIFASNFASNNDNQDIHQYDALARQVIMESWMILQDSQFMQKIANNLLIKHYSRVYHHPNLIERVVEVFGHVVRKNQQPNSAQYNSDYKAENGE
jgi:hypothetical protein